MMQNRVQSHLTEISLSNIERVNLLMQTTKASDHAQSVSWGSVSFGWGVAWGKCVSP
jgi:hypothetical protein